MMFSVSVSNGFEITQGHFKWCKLMYTLYYIFWMFCRVQMEVVQLKLYVIFELYRCNQGLFWMSVLFSLCDTEFVEFIYFFNLCG